MLKKNIESHQSFLLISIYLIIGIFRLIALIHVNILMSMWIFDGVSVRSIMSFDNMMFGNFSKKWDRVDIVRSFFWFWLEVEVKKKKQQQK